MAAKTRGAVMVTGSLTGIGEACVRHLSRHGFLVFATVRRPEDVERLHRYRSPRIIPLRLDAANAAALGAAAERVAGMVAPAGLAGLINNAGIAVGGPLEFLPLSALRSQLEVNVVGQLAVTQAFLPLLRRGRGRIVMVGSASGRLATPLSGAYCAAKFALEALTTALRLELASQGVQVVMVEPGGVATPIWRRSLDQAEAWLQRSPQAEELYGPMMEAARRYARDRSRSGVPPDEVARVVVRAMIARKPERRYIVGRDARLALVSRLLPEPLREWIALRFLRGFAPPAG